MITVFDSGTILDDLRAIELVTPDAAGRRWKAIPHADLVDTIKDEVRSRGWGIKRELYSTASEGADMAGALLLDNVRGVFGMPEGTDLALGFLNNNARRRALQITVGAEVACCTNGICTGNIILSRVHDHTVDLVGEIGAAVDKYVLAATDIPVIMRGLRETKISPGQASEVLMAAGRQRLVGWAAIGRVDYEYRHPTFAEHGIGTAWALLNAFTYAARPNIAPTRQMGVYDAFRRLLLV